MNKERLALTAALEAVARTPEQERLHRAATEIHSETAVAYLRHLVHGDFATLNTEDEPVVDVEIAEATKERQLSPEATERTLSTLKTRFDANSHLHEGCEWNRVKAALEADPESLWSIANAEAAGHKPDVYNFDDSGFDIGTCSKETPTSARNCVYDAEAAQRLRTNRPDATFNGSAVEMSEAMGFPLMPPAHYKDILQTKDKFDEKTGSWLLTDGATRKSGYALIGDRSDFGVVVSRDAARRHRDGRGWRGSLRVSWS